MVRCRCGQTLSPPSERRRHRCPGCGAIHDRHSDHYGTTAVATRESWKREPPEGPFDAVDVQWSYAPDDLERIRWGLTPRAMEEKWAAFVEGEELLLYRSWTGILCFAVSLTSAGVDRVRIARHLPNHPSQLKTARWLVESLLVGRDWEFPGL